MRRRNIGLTVNGPTPPLAYPQNVPSFAYPYETGFLPSPVAVSPPGYTLEPADSGARFVLSFSNVPAGVQVFLPISVIAPVAIQSGYPSHTGIFEPQIQLVQAQPNGFSGPAYTAVPTTATIGTTPVAQASRIGTKVFATYEVVNVETAEADTFNIPFALAFNGSTPQSGTIVALSSLAPISTTGVAATNSEPVPRFVPTNFTPPATPSDFDGNGVSDRIWQNDTTGQATVHYAGYTGLDLQAWNWLNNSVIHTWRIVAVADFNGDGIPDLVWLDSVTREVTVHYYLGSWNWLQSTPVPGWTVVGAAGFNGDGIPDLVWQNDTTHQVVVHYYGGTGGAAYQGWNWLQSNAFPGWHGVGAADFNRDGVPDLVWQNDTTGQVVVHYYGGAVYQAATPSKQQCRRTRRLDRSSSVRCQRRWRPRCALAKHKHASGHRQLLRWNRRSFGHWPELDQRSGRPRLVNCSLSSNHRRKFLPLPPLRFRDSWISDGALHRINALANRPAGLAGCFEPHVRDLQ